MVERSNVRDTTTPFRTNRNPSASGWRFQAKVIVFAVSETRRSLKSIVGAEWNTKR